MQNNVTVVVGGQYGSEAKAKACVRVAQDAAINGQIPISVRCGGPNAGHTIWFGNHKHVCRLIPSGVAVPQAQLVLAPGAMIDKDLLLSEIKVLEGPGIGTAVRRRLFISPQCVMVDRCMVEQEQQLAMGAAIGSTQTGTGSTTAARAMRSAVKVSDDPGMLGANLCDYTYQYDTKDGYQRHIIVEGTQGFGLSLYHSGFYPFCTSRDTTAAAFISEAGISPRDVTDIIMVVRTYPIRVGGNSGPMYKELDWSIIRERCNCPDDLIEMTSVTKKVRRVGEFDWQLFKRALVHNKPTKLAVHGLDYLNWADHGVRDVGDLSNVAKSFIRNLEDFAGVKVAMAFTGPHQDDMVTYE